MENEKQFNILEKAVLNWIAGNSKDPNVIAQIKAVQFVERGWTKVGFYVKLAVPEGLGIIGSIEKRTVMNGPSIESKDIEFGGGSLIFCEKGYLDTLEMYANGSFFRENVTDFNFLRDPSASV